MPTSALLRAVSVITMVLLYAVLPYEAYLSLFFACALGHYALAFIYSKGQIQKIIKTPRIYTACAVLVVLSAIIIIFRLPPLIIYFGIHHILNETYFMSQQTGNLTYSKQLKVSRFFLNSFCYLIMMRFYFHLYFLWTIGFIAAVFVSYGFFTFYMHKEKGSIRGAVFLDQHLFEMMGIAVAFSTIFLPFEFRSIIFYHGLFWFYLGLIKSKQKGTVTLTHYLLWTVVVSGVFYLLTPTANLPIQLTDAVLNGQVELWGYIHISASFALSALNPIWITRYFYLLPKPAFSTRQS